MPKSAILIRPSRIQQEILRIDIAVDDALVMGIFVMGIF
jgi:hypothetical protein